MRIAALVSSHAKRQSVHVHRFANAGNHLHFLIECREKEKFQAFLRAVSGAIALFIRMDDAITMKKRSDQIEKKSLWLQRPWTRLVAASGSAFVAAWRYVDLNAIEGGCWGITRREARFIQYGDLGPPRPWLKV